MDQRHQEKTCAGEMKGREGRQEGKGGCLLSGMETLEAIKG
jgi:hypothetical protein